MSGLAAVEAARVARDGDDARLKATARAALDAGVPLAAVARAAGVSRPTLYRWLHESPSPKETTP